MEKKEMEDRMRATLQRRIYEEQRRIRADKDNVSIEQLIEMVCKKPQEEYERQQMDLLKKFVAQRGMQDRDGEQFQKILRETQGNLGTYSIKMAHDYVNKLFRDKGKPSDQEKISFVKMEYFLYGITQAHRVIQDLKKLEEREIQLKEKHEILSQETEILQRQASQYSRMSS